jgi:hypothetical protein
LISSVVIGQWVAEFGKVSGRQKIHPLGCIGAGEEIAGRAFSVESAYCVVDSETVSKVSGQSVLIPGLQSPRDSLT